MTKSNKTRIAKKVTNFVKDLDVFGVPITLTFKGETQVKSLFGGIMTVLFRLGLLAYLAYACSQVIQRSATIQYSGYQLDLRTDSTEYILTSANFDIAFQTEYMGLSSENATFQTNFNIYQYLEVKLNQNSAYWESTSQGTIQKKVKTQIALEKCGENRFGIANDTEDYLNIDDTYLCPNKDFTFQLRGNQASKDNEYIQFQLKLCNQTFLDTSYPGQKCASLAEQLRIAAQLKIYVVVQNSYFDDKDFSDNPIKKIIRPYFLYSVVGTDQHLYLSVGRHRVERNDAVFYGSTIEQHFVETRLNYISTQGVEQKANMTVITFDIEIDDTVKIITRTVYNFWDAFSDVGGFGSSLLVVFSIIVGQFQDIIFNSIIIRNLYKYQQNRMPTDQNKVSENKSLNNGKFTEQSPINDDESSVSQFNTLLEDLKNRVKFAYSLREQLKFKIKNCCCKRKLSTQERYRQKLFSIGKEKIERDFDIEHITKQLQCLKFISFAVLSKYQRTMIRYSNLNLLEYYEQEKLQKMNKKKRIEKYLESHLKELTLNSQPKDQRILNAIAYKDKFYNENTRRNSELQIDGIGFTIGKKSEEIENQKLYDEIQKLKSPIGGTY